MSKFILLLAALMIFNGCSKDEKRVAEIQYQDRIMPLAVDNYWLFDDVTYDSPYEWEEVSKIGISGFRSVTYDSIPTTVYYWNWYDMPQDRPQERKNLVRNEDEGLFYYGQQIGSAISEIRRLLFIKYPVSEGEEWVYADDASIRSVSVSTVIETPLGDLDCLVYEIIPVSEEGRSFIATQFGINRKFYQRNEIITYLYYKPEVGYVGMDIYEGEELIFKRRLSDYYVKIPPSETGLLRGPLSP